MKSLKIAFLLLVVVFYSCGSDLSYEQQIKNYNFYVNKSDSLIKNENYRKSISYSNAAIEISDTLAIAIYLKGLASFKLNWLEEAEDNFSEVIDIEGDKSSSYKDRAKVFFKKNDNDFIDDINIYLKSYPNNEEAHILKRKYFEKNGNFEKAIEEYNLVLKKEPNNIDLLTKRGDLYFKNGDYSPSVNDYEQVLKLNPQNDKIKRKKSNILSLINKNSNRNILIIILISFYLIYVAVSFLILKPLVNKKAINQIGGEFEMSKDSLIWVLPIILTIVFIVLFFSNLIPNF
jgi:tetratricopeptide (TPR) repeat protein